MMMVYSRRVLRLSSGIDDIGPVMWDLALSLMLAWLFTFFCLFKGIKVSGKVRQTLLRLLYHNSPAPEVMCTRFCSRFFAVHPRMRR